MKDPNLGWVIESQNHSVIAGTKLHSNFDNGKWRRAWLNKIRQKKNLSRLPLNISNYAEKREHLINLIADFVNANLDLSALLEQ